MRLLLIFLLLPFAVFADCDQHSTANPSCVDTEKLQVRLGFGAGHRSNPLAGGRNLPYWLIPDISYYGKNWFFDNGSLGYSVELAPSWQLSLQSRLNEEKGYFQRAHASNVFQRFMFNSAEVTGPAPRAMTKQSVAIDQVESRPTAIDAGLQLDWFGPELQVRLNWWHDISNTYQGQHASFTAQRGWSYGDGYWQLHATLHWKSANLMQTYYGVTDGEHELFYYQPSDSWQPELKLSYSYPLSTTWSALMFYRYRWLDDAMTQSPLVVEQAVHGWFIGLSYQFF